MLSLRDWTSCSSFTEKPTKTSKRQMYDPDAYWDASVFSFHLVGRKASVINFFFEKIKKYYLRIKNWDAVT